MIAGKRSARWAGVSALALLGFGVAAPEPAFAACTGTANATQVNNAGTLETTVNTVAVTCVAGAPDTGLFATSFTGFPDTGYVLFDYDGSGADTLNISGGTIVNVTTPPNPTPVISGIPFQVGTTTTRSLDADAAGVRLLNGDDQLGMTGGTVTGNLVGGGGGDTFNITGGIITGTLFGDAEVGQVDGADTVTVGGNAAIQGSIFTGAGIDRVDINDNAAIGLLAGQFDSVGLEDGDDFFTMTGGTTAGGVSGNAGVDIFTLSAGTIGTYVAGGTGADVFNISGTAAIGAQLTTEDDADAVTMDGGTVGTFVDLGAADDTFTMTAGTVQQFVLGGDGADTVTVLGGTVGTVGGAGAQGLFGGIGNDQVTVLGGTINGGLFGDAGDDTLVVGGGAVTGGLTGGDGTNVLVVQAGTVGGNLTGGADGDTILVTGGAVAGGAEGGNGANTFVIQGGSVGGNLSGGADADTFIVSAGTVGGALTGGAGAGTFVIEGGTIGGGLTGGADVDSFTISGGTMGALSGGAGADVFALSGGTLAGPLSGGDDADQITISGTALLNSFLVGDAGADTVEISGGTINGFVDLNDGDDTLSMTGGTLNNHIEGNGGNDTITVSGGTVRDFVYGNDGDDTITISGTAAIGGDVLGQTGTDRIRVSGGTIGGNVQAETVELTGGTIAGNITGLSANTLIINSGSALNLRDGVLFSGNNAVGTITASDLARSAGGGVFRTVVFQGFQQATATGSQLGFGPGTQQIANLLLNAGSTLYSRGVVNLVSPTGGPGNLTVTNSTIDLINNSTADVLNVGNLTLNNAVIRLDANQQQNVADLISEAGALTATGANVFFVNLLGTPNLSGVNIIPISPEAGETVNPNATASSLFAVQGVVNNTGALFAYDVIFGSNGGLYLRSRGQDFVSPQATRVAIDSQPIETVTASIYDILSDAILHELGLVVSSSRADGAPAFGIYASGQFAEVKHDGFRISNATFSGLGPSFTASDFSVAASVELDAAAYFGLDKSVGLDIGLFGGYASSAVELDPTLLFSQVGEAENRSGMIGSYGLYRMGTTYGLVSATGFFGNTEVNNSILASTGDYDTQGYAITGTVGHVFAIDDNIRFDLRGGLLGAFFDGDAYTDTGGTRFGKSSLSFGAVKFEPGVYGQYVLSDGTVMSPYLRLEIQQRFAYSNTGSIDGIGFEFDDADLSASVSGGINYKINATTTLSTELKSKVSEDSQTFAGKIGVKARF